MTLRITFSKLQSLISNCHVRLAYDRRPFPTLLTSYFAQSSTSLSARFITGAKPEINFLYFPSIPQPPSQAKSCCVHFCPSLWRCFIKQSVFNFVWKKKLFLRMVPWCVSVGKPQRRLPWERVALSARVDKLILLHLPLSLDFLTWHEGRQVHGTATPIPPPNNFGTQKKQHHKTWYNHYAIRGYTFKSTRHIIRLPWWQSWSNDNNCCKSIQFCMV